MNTELATPHSSAEVLSRESGATTAPERDCLLSTYVRPTLIVERGEGCYFWDTEGRRYLDFITGVGVNALGHAHPRVVRAIQEQAAACVHSSNLFHHPYQAPLARKLAEWSGLQRAFFSNSGTEAVELAIKAARSYARRMAKSGRKIVALLNSFHGRSTGALAVTGQEDYRKPFEPLLGDVVFIPANDNAALRQAVDETTIAVITETIQGEGGIYPLSSAFLTDVRELSAAANALWIADETQCGLGRTGARFAYHQHPEAGLPDIVVTAKPLAGGLPLGATLLSEDVASVMGPGTHGSTFGGGPLACRVALEVLDEIDALLPRIDEAGKFLFDRLRWLQERHDVIREVRGAGLMAGIQLSMPGKAVVERCLLEGLAINCTHDMVLRLLPAYIVTNRQIDDAIEVLDSVLQLL